ncbi:hypothetical protein K1W54_04785 [Micromonospora sp. CPCC 205371]|nr:hypothetical protein [Micromonospora sp. CPCC 205371]
MTSEPTYAALRTHNKRIAGMLADPECAGELLLVGLAMARRLDLNDPVWPREQSMPLKPIAYAVYGRYRQPPNLLVPNWGPRGDSHPRKRLLDVFRHDRRRYQPDSWRHGIACGRPMLRRDGLCGRHAANELTRTLTDPATGLRHWVGACSQKPCRAWFADLLDRNAAELKASPPPVPPANTGGVLERHLPEIDWWQVWRHVDPNWTPPPEGRPFERPTLRLLIGDEASAPVVDTPRPALTVHEGGWR